MRVGGREDLRLLSVRSGENAEILLSERRSVKGHLGRYMGPRAWVPTVVKAKV